MTSAKVQSMASVRPSPIVSPLTSARTWSASRPSGPTGSSSGVTSHGPSVDAPSLPFA